MDVVIADHAAGSGFVTGWLGELDTSTGMLRYVNAGHPLARVLRGGHVVKALDGAPTLPLGLGTQAIVVTPEPLEPGDRVLIFTDGVVEGRHEKEGFLGEERLLDPPGRGEDADQGRRFAVHPRSYPPAKYGKC